MIDNFSIFISCVVFVFVLIMGVLKDGRDGRDGVD